jgi:hypothetical protein
VLGGDGGGSGGIFRMTITICADIFGLSLVAFVRFLVDIGSTTEKPSEFEL